MGTHWREHYYEDDDGNKCLDLHYLSERDAMRNVKAYLKRMKKEYRWSNRRRSNRFVDIITGIGRHSWRNFSVIKRDVWMYLDYHCYSCNWDEEGGRVTIDLYRSDV